MTTNAPSSPANSKMTVEPSQPAREPSIDLWDVLAARRELKVDTTLKSLTPLELEWRREEGTEAQPVVDGPAEVPTPMSQAQVWRAYAQWKATRENKIPIGASKTQP